MIVQRKTDGVFWSIQAKTKTKKGETALTQVYLKIPQSLNTPIPQSIPPLFPLDFGI
jgi:hypothetical protein